MTVKAIAPSPAVVAGLSRRRRIGVLLICSMSLLIVGLDVTIVNIALPSIRREFHAPLSGLQWTVDAYTLVLASLLMLSGSTADRLGRRRTFVVGLLTFAAGSLLCSVAPNLNLLVVFRMVQAVGGSMLNPVAMSIITNTFTIPRERAQAIGVWAGVIGVAMALGPVLGGALVTSVGWRSIFWINIPVGLTAVILARRYIPESKAPVARRLDVPGQVLVIMLLASLTYGIIEAPSRGSSSPLVMGAFATAAVSLVALLIWEHRASEPLIDLRFFRSVPFSSAAVIAVAAFAALGGFLFLNTLYLQDVRGLSPLQAGLDTLPMAAMTMVLPPLSGRIVGWQGGRIPLVIAGAAVAAACLMLVGLSAVTPFSWLFTAYVVFGIGFGFVNAPITNTAVSGMPRSQAGVAAAIASTSRQIGQTLGVAVVGSLVSASLQKGNHLDFALASRAGWWVLAGCGAGVLLLGLVATTPWARETARRTAESINPEISRTERSMTKASIRRDRAIREAWHAMAGLVLDNERRREVSEQTGLSFGKMRALRRIAGRPMSMRELAGLLGMDPPNLTTVVDDLERSGLVERQAHPTDRRVKLVAATPKGAALAQRAEEILDRPPAGLVDLPSHELETLVRILAQVRQEQHPSR